MSTRFPKPATIETFDLGPESVLVLRDREATIRGFHNVCRHRGARILDGSRQLPRDHHLSLSRLDLSPGRRPHRHAGSRELSRARPGRTWPAAGANRYCLRLRVRVLWRGDPPPVTQDLGRIRRGIRALSHSKKWCRSGRSTAGEWNVDWKIAMDNYLESYHVPIGHPGLYRMFTPDYEDQAAVPGIARGVSWMREQESPRWSEGLYQKHDRASRARICPRITAAAGVSTARCRISASTCFRTRWTSFRCCRADRANASFAAACSACPMSAREMRAVRYLSARINTQVNNEDKWLCGAGAARTRLRQLQTGPAVAARTLDARVPQLVARAHSGICSRELRPSNLLDPPGAGRSAPPWPGARNRGRCRTKAGDVLTPDVKTSPPENTIPVPIQPRLIHADFVWV